MLRSSLLAGESNVNPRFLQRCILHGSWRSSELPLAEVDLEVEFLTSPPSLTWHVPVTGLSVAVAEK